jgi:hypothetical protein
MLPPSMPVCIYSPIKASRLHRIYARINCLISDCFQQRIGHPLSIGIAIHISEVVVDNIGSEKKMDYMVTVQKRLEEATRNGKNSHC